MKFGRLEHFIGPLRWPGFRNYLAGQMGFMTANTALTAVLTMLVYQQQGTGYAVGLLMFVRFFPPVVLGVLAGVFVDRWNRRLGLILSQILFAVIGSLFVFGTNLPAILALGFVYMVVFAYVKPLRFAVIPGLVTGEQLILANSFMLGGGEIAAMVGSALAGIGFQKLGAQGVILPGAALMLASVWCYRRLNLPGPEAGVPTGAREGMWSQLGEGWRYLIHHPVLLPLTWVITVLWLAVGAQSSIVIILVIRALGLDNAHYGYMISAMSVGGMIGIFAAPAVTRLLRVPTPCSSASAYSSVACCW